MHLGVLIVIVYALMQCFMNSVKNQNTANYATKIFQNKILHEKN